jgi:hypothetical protein
MKGYKGFDKNLKCRDFQFEVGKEYIHEGEIKLCNSGFHFCESPLDVFDYYLPSESRFAEIEADQVSYEKSNDSKRVSKKITIKTELNLHSFLEARLNFILENIDLKNAKENNKKVRGAASNSGWQGAASNSGEQGAASNSGEDGIAMSVGIESKAKAIKGTWIVLSEWKIKDNKYHRIDVQAKIVDGKKIKADTFYILKNGKFTKAVD